MMKISVKVLNGNRFEIDVQPNDTVMAVKKQLEQIQGEDSLPCGKQLLIYQGNVLKDDTIMDDNEVTDNSFLLVMLTKEMELVTKMTACPLDSAILSKTTMEDCSCISEFHAMRGSSAFFKITESFLTDEAAIDRMDSFSTFSQEQMLNRDVNLAENPERSPWKVEAFYEEHNPTVEDMNLINQMVALGLPQSFGTSCQRKHLRSTAKNRKPTKHKEFKPTAAREGRDSLLVQAEFPNKVVVDPSITSQDSVSSLVELSFNNPNTPMEAASNGINTSCALSCQNDSSLFSESFVASNSGMASMQSNDLDDSRTALPVNDKTEMGSSLEEMLEVEVREAKPVERSDEGQDKHLKSEFPCCIQSRTQSSNMGADSEIDCSKMESSLEEMVEVEATETVLVEHSEKGQDEHLKSECLCCIQSRTQSSNLGADSEINCSKASHPSHALEISLPDDYPTVGTQNIGMGKWEPVWDTYYQRYYYCNCETWETSWDPQGLDLSADFSSSVTEANSSVTGDQAICGTNNKSYDGDPGSNLTDENDAIGITHAEYENILEVFQEIEDNVLNKPDSSACKVLHMASDSIESEELSGKGISNIEGLSANSEFGNRADNQKQLEIIDVDLVSACPQKAEEIATSKDNAQCVEQLGECFLCQELRETSCKKKGSGSIGSLEASLDTMDSSQGLPQACGTHIWFDEDGNVMDKHSLQSVATQVHSQEIENYIESGEETTFADASTSEVLSVGDVLPIRGQEKKKRSRLRRLSSTETNGEPLKKLHLPGIVEGMSTSITKYWCQRYQLFSRFDKGVKLDEEGWFSVTPEVVAKHHAVRCRTGTVIDCFSGVGGNAIQFAQTCQHVIAIDIDPRKIDYAQHNARIYGVADYIDFIIGDFYQLAPSLKADVVFLSPPWGGPDYMKTRNYDIQDMLKPKDGFSLFKAAQMIAQNIVMFLPRNVDLNQLVELSWLSCPPFAFEIEKNYVNGKLKAITAYYGDISLCTSP